MKILVVEDSATLRHAMGGYINAAGHEPIFAHSGEEALQMLENTPVDLIIMDVEMPGLNGFETTRLMREWLGDHWIPIIFVTGKSEEESFAEGIDAGGDDYLIKPVSPVILKAKICALERISIMRDQMQTLNEELETLSQRDSLTQCYNRRTFHEQAKQFWAQAARTQQPVSLIMLDIDHFKLYNDHYGHPAGDSCLKQVAKALQDSLHRPIDLLARYGGEEFIIFLPDTDLAGARRVGETIRQSLAQLKIRHDASKTNQYVTASIGCSTSQVTTGRTLEDLINHADQILYRSKESGRDCLTVEEFAPHKTILVADDDPDTLTLVTDLLESHCNILTSDNGNECLEIARDVRPDLILMDIHMPEMSGSEVCRQLRANNDTASIPVIFISSEERREQLRLGKQVGANECLEKPLDEKQLVAKINRFLL